MQLQRYNPSNINALRRNLRSYYRNPSPEKRQHMEQKLQRAVDAMYSVERAISESHQLVIALFQEFISYEDESPISVSEPIVEPASAEPLEITQEELISVDPETRESNFRLLTRAFDGNPELEAQLKYLLDIIIRRQPPEVKINDAKAIMSISNTVYVRKLLDRLTRRGFLKTSGKTKAKKYSWTGTRPDWIAPPLPTRIDTSCPKCSRTMKQKDDILKCPTRGCPGKRRIEGGDIIRSSRPVVMVSQASILAGILNDTASHPSRTLFIDKLKQTFNIDMSLPALKALLEKQPEIEVRGNEVTRKADEAYKCPFKSDRQYMKIAYATRADGSQPARRAWVAFAPKTKMYFTKLFERLCEHGRIDDGAKFKRLEGDIWEFKSNTHKRRITCFIVGKVIYLAHIFKKKEDKTPHQELTLAETIMAEHMHRLSAVKRRRYARKRHFQKNPHANYFPNHFPRVNSSLYRGLRYYPY